MPGPHVNWTVDILGVDFAAVSKTNVNPLADAFVDNGRDAYAARLSKSLQACGDVDAIAVYVIALKNDITQIDADSKHDNRLGRLFV